MLEGFPGFLGMSRLEEEGGWFLGRREWGTW